MDVVRYDKEESMQITTLHEVEEALRDVDPLTLREMAYQIAHSHATVCGLTSSEGECAHVPDQETRDRVDGLTGHELAAMLAPSAWVSIELHTHLHR